MGSCFDSTVWPSSDVPALLKRYRAYQEEMRDEHGHDGYNGTASNCYDLHVQDRHFDRVSDAENYLSDSLGKREAAAVKVWIRPQPKDSDKAKLDALMKDYRDLEREISLYPTQVIIPRVKAAKSKTKGCACGSSIAVDYIGGVFCPVCRKDFLTTDTDKAKLESLKAKLTKAREKFTDQETQVKLKLKATGWCWVLGWWAPE